MKYPTRAAAFVFSLVAIVLACTKQIDLKTEVEFSVTVQHEPGGYINENLPTRVTVVPEAILEEFSYSYSYSVTEGEGYFMDNRGAVFPQDETIALQPLSAEMMYVGTQAGNHLVKVVATDNYGFTEEVEIDYTVAEIPPVVWTTSSPVKRMKLHNTAPITVHFEADLDRGVQYERRYRFVSGLGRLTEVSDRADIELAEFRSITPGTYTLNFTPLELGTVELVFDLQGDNGDEYSATLGFKVLEEIEDSVPPKIALLGEHPYTIQRGGTYDDPGAMATDDVDGDISANLVVDDSKVNTAQVGAYRVTYNVKDASGNAAVEVIRTVTVIAGGNPQRGENDILTFAVPGQQDASVIDPTRHTVTINVPSGTATNVAPIALSVSADASITPSRDEVRDFINPVTYIVSAQNGDQQEWTVTVNVAASSDKSIESFTMAGVAGVISDTDILVTLPPGSDASSQTPAVQFIGAGLSPNSGTTVDFTTTVPYTVTAEDGSTKEYKVTVIVEKSTEKEITDFVIEGVPGSIDGTTITVTLPAGNDEKSLSPTIVHTGESISPAFDSTHDFTDPVSFTVTAEDGSQKTYGVSVTITGDRPTANISANPMTVSLNQDINFTGDASTDDIQIISYSWDFGDGTTSSAANPVHSYSSHGIYTVSLTVADDGGLTDMASVQIEVPNVGPTASASANPIEIREDRSVYFNGSNSTDDLGISSHTWNFGDGNTSSAPNPVHIYTSPGIYTAGLTVTDTGGLTDTEEITITVLANQRPTSVTSADIFNGIAPLTVNFRGSDSSDPENDPLSYQWQFGPPGATSTMQNPTYTYNSPGEYIVTLTVSDDDLSHTSSLVITVRPATTFDAATGLYTAPAGSTVTVTLHSKGTGKGRAEVGAGPLSLTTAWNGGEHDTFSENDSHYFTMPPSGEIYFSGSHRETYGSSDSNVTMSNNQGPSQGFYMDKDEKIPK
ncbi:PKD domain-containing protein [Pricia sp. S334]|uniref:PKD domain-containing protein n=1 Tax=Pricia mediterranea TaxID=3076079 RepID=A0ABU3LAI6_9FLAO|nr:PKD domain-containing protein [Pricia sp. S334]MDT7830507.1 PKD domain-containing protein [Pricia sp. S334]